MTPNPAPTYRVEQRTPDGWSPVATLNGKGFATEREAYAMLVSLAAAFECDSTQLRVVRES